MTPTRDPWLGPPGGADPRISVVLPTYQRRDVVSDALRALADQVYDQAYEVIVVVDGSTDGTAEALRAMQLPFPLTVLEQANAGAAAARNAGAHQARGDIVLFLDDDMEADPHLLAEHDRVHREGADAVLGHMPLHPESARTTISDAVQSWSLERLVRLSQPGAVLTLHDLLTGQLSVSTAVFRDIGGFDAAFTHGGSFGNEDVDFGHRLLRGNYDIRFNPAAVSHQRYVVTPRQHLRQWRQAGSADVRFARKHPPEALDLFELNGLHTPFAQRVARPLAAVPAWSAITWPARSLAVLVGDRRGRMPGFVFFRARSLEYWRGVHEAGGIPTGTTVRVLAYHAISDVQDPPVLRPYGVPLDRFRRQLAVLRSHGFTLITPEEFAGFVERRQGLPRRAVLLTFDDCYADLRQAGELLRAEGHRALAFAVSHLLGRTNEWDSHYGGPPRALLGAAGLAHLRAAGVEIGGHSRTHQSLAGKPGEVLEDEMGGCVDDLEAEGLGPIRFFAYPYGEHDEQVRARARAFGFTAAFAIDPGLTNSKTDLMRVPRVEVLRSDRGLLFLIKLLAPRAHARTVAAHRRVVTTGRRARSRGGRFVRAIPRGIRGLRNSSAPESA
ncbi:glycosyltransferase [Modestobacter sp. URMC 112]